MHLKADEMVMETETDHLLSDIKSDPINENLLLHAAEEYTSNQKRIQKSY